MRHLTKDIFNALNDGELHELLEYVQNDDTLDMEFRENSFTLYYRGGALLSVSETKSKKYVWNPLDANYNDGHKLKNNPENFEEYIPEAKHLIDYHICISKQNKLGEKEIQQLVVKENNYSPNSNDTDYFIVDMEYTEEGDKDKTRFDLIAVRWDSNGPARKKDEVSLAIIEVKQGYQSVKSSTSSPGLFKHKKDFDDFVDKKKKEKTLDAFCEDMVEIFKQKCALRLIKGNDRMENMKMKIKDGKIEDDIKWSPDIEFICLLANYKESSSNFIAELMGEEDNNSMKPCKIIVSNYTGYGLFANNIIDISSGISDEGNAYLDAEKRKQALLFATEVKKGEKSIFSVAKNFGNMWNKKLNKWYHYPYILKHEYSLYNLYTPIRQDVLEYFNLNDIEWWKQSEDRYFPTGNLVSSQIHCLNHLFALREDKDAVLAVINNATNMEFDEVLPSTLDNDGGYIAFEYAYKNDELLGENDKGARRGVFCTSIDAMIVARKGEEKWLIPIEWKYTETYEKEDKTCQKRLERYEELIKKSERLKMPENGQIPHSIYFQEPSYELMRQTLLCEQLKHNGLAKNFFHLNVIPDDNTALRENVKKEFIPMLKDKSKFRIIDPQELLSPLRDNDKYEDLITYLETRYWNS